jgi:rare lipoprotein A
MQIVMATCGARGWCLVGVLTTVTLVLLSAARPAVSAARPGVQVGLASWYGPGFHGDETASGEIFDQREMVAAHRSLPLGSVVRVTNLENGRRVVLRVIDRGPYGRNYRKGTIIDVSKGAARRLDFIRDGLVKVRVEVLRLGAKPAGRIPG